MPTQIEGPEFKLVPLGPALAEIDYRAYMSSIAHLQATFTRSTSWPNEGITMKDAMVDMENHAQTNTSVELGGVLLGGQYVDSQGEPFVVVSDCLRADHFEATKGSFKFTHETWSDTVSRLF